ncbi:GGDEF domain-containing protein [Planosporangium thailandense]|uniref:GGDEF domain-containing protein n=1 Tax=Planosporangium thailandense TaxID=765197 RepID=A0ABX0XXV7_9ACTN|nr:GGDEF domain-containing protein [Planosporangium thailandense]NJC70874.1 GGDEF domain-containing protein [Planosporangium thailandense]
MTPADPTVTPPDPLSRQVRAIRVSNVYSAVGPVIALGYVLGTLGQPHRPTMLAVLAAMLAVAALGWWQAKTIARSRLRVPIQLSGVVANLASSALLGLLDGGIASPLGDLIPFSLVFFAILVPPRLYAGVAALSLAAYWSVVQFGDPAPAGYAVAHVLGFLGTGYLCLWHAGLVARLRRRLVELSRIDPLTGCLNRRGFDQRLERKLAAGTPMTLVLVDLDRFKDVNDTYGHRTGDRLLSWAGRTLTDALRAPGAVGRLGGDEFAVIVGDTGPDAAAAVVERLRDAMQVAATASFGHASFPADAYTMEEVKRIADERLYADKARPDRRAPSADQVAAARVPVERRVPAPVAPGERRRHSIADTGRMAVMMGVIGLQYVAFFATHHPHRLGMALLSVFGGMVGLGIIAMTGWLSRSPAARMVINLAAVVLFAIMASVAILDGGVSAPTGVGLLMAMPLLALGTRARAVLPALTAASLLYLGIAVFAGTSSGWYAATHLAGAVAASLACALQGWSAARQRALVDQLSRIDPLTGCLNRRGFEERFTAELTAARSSGRHVTLLILDLDGFKQTNDSGGHAAGDELLRWVGRTLRDGVRPDDDVVGRLGGDEFVVLVVGGDADTVTARLRAALNVRASVSIGAATLWRDGHDFDTLYARADARLYAEKAQRPYASAPVEN